MDDNMGELLFLIKYGLIGAIGALLIVYGFYYVIKEIFVKKRKSSPSSIFGMFVLFVGIGAIPFLLAINRFCQYYSVVNKDFMKLPLIIIGVLALLFAGIFNIYCATVVAKGSKSTIKGYVCNIIEEKSGFSKRYLIELEYQVGGINHKYRIKKSIKDEFKYSIGDSFNLILNEDKNDVYYEPDRKKEILDGFLLLLFGIFAIVVLAFTGIN